MLVSSQSHSNRALSEQSSELRPPARDDLHDAPSHERMCGGGTALACERAENFPKHKVACRSKTYQAAAEIGAVALTEATNLAMQEATQVLTSNHRPNA